MAQKRKNPLKSTLHGYASVTTIHGISYKFGEKRPLDRVFWVAVVLLALGMVIHLSTNSYLNWQEDPVITSIGNAGYPIEKVKFPAITICAQGSVREIVDAAIFKQFNEYLISKNKVFTNLKNKELGEEGHAFLNEVYPGAKMPPNKLVAMMASPAADSDKSMKADAILNPEPDNDCDEGFEDEHHNRAKRSNDQTSSNSECPEGWWDNKYGSCIYYHDVKLTFTDAKYFCDNHAIGGAKLLEIKSNGTDSIKDYITLYDELKKGDSPSQGNDWHNGDEDASLSSTAINARFTLITENVGLRSSCSYSFEIFKLPREEASLEKCANEVTTNSACGNIFFFRANVGRCYCEKPGSDCTRKTNENVNEYSLIAGPLPNESTATTTTEPTSTTISDPSPTTVDEGAFGGKIGLREQFWVNANRDRTKGNRFFYEDMRPVVPLEPNAFIANDDTNNTGRPSVTLRACGASYHGKYWAVSATDTDEHKVFCMIDSPPSSTTGTPEITTEEPGNDIPVTTLPKMPTFCPIKRRKKRESKGQSENAKNTPDNVTRSIIYNLKEDTSTMETSRKEAMTKSSEQPQKRNIEKLNLMLDPKQKVVRMKQSSDAKKKYDDEFGDLDFIAAYAKLFEILWYSQLPCFDIRNITSQNKDEMSLIKRCYWKGRQMSCSSIFVTRTTDRGMCCTFNMEKAESIFKESKYASAVSRLQQQDMEEAFEDSSLPSWYVEGDEPKSQPGPNKGLTLILDAHSNRISSGTVFDNFRGFSTVIDGGDKYPLTLHSSMLVRPGRENYVAMSGVHIDTNQEIINISPEIRNCYFIDEYPLKMHMRYSQSNCILECRIDYARGMMLQYHAVDQCTHFKVNVLNDTISEIKAAYGMTSTNETIENSNSILSGCAPWYYPADDHHYTNVCDPWDTKLFQCYLTNVPDNTCKHCLPDCTTTMYESKVTSVPFRACDHTNLGLSSLCDLEDTDLNPPMWAQAVEDEFRFEDEIVPDFARPRAGKMSNIRNTSINPRLIDDVTLKHQFLKNPSYNAFEKDIALVTFYFEKANILQFKRNLKMRMINFIGQLGGLLGLGLGFSFISFVEILYWATLKFYANLIGSKPHHWPKKTLQNAQ